MTQSQKIEAFVSGTHNLLPDESIPKDAASNSLNWLTRNGKIELIYGRQYQGSAGSAGKSNGEHTGYKVDGTEVRFRKVSTKIQYYDGSAWQNIITGLTSSDVTFANYQSLAGSFVYIFSPDDGIYKIVTANPGSYATLYNASKNFKGYGLIDKGRTILWGVKKDPTGLYGSYIDGQDSSVYTTVSAEAIGSSGSTNYTGTLAFKAGGATRTCFGVSFTDGTETFTDNYDGTLTGDAGGTGTINYMSGAYNITFDSAAAGSVTADYQWEDSNAKGVTDFTKSATRVAGEGFVLRQDIGGDAIKVVLPLDGSYISLKNRSAYQLTLDVADTSPLNEVIRTDIGVETLRSAVSTSKGIIFLNSANLSKPQLNVLQRNITGDNFDVAPLFPQFKWENYTYSDVMVDTWDKFILVSCMYDASNNNRLILADVVNNTVDVTYYGVRCITKSGGYLYGGDPVSDTTYELFTGFDDAEIKIDNYWESAGELYGSDVLKKTKKYRFKGIITPDQSVRVSISTDDGEWQRIGTITGKADYVDYTTSYAIGTYMVGTGTVGGDDGTSAYNFFMEIKVRIPKFRKRKLKLEALGFGYVAIEQITDFDIWTYQDRLPKGYRSKQNVSLDGTSFNQDSPEY